MDPKTHQSDKKWPQKCAVWGVYFITSIDLQEASGRGIFSTNIAQTENI